ncbi:cytochrome C [beta proteobacterium AAP99]|nr:cytochrome C [beta proteobacterium AAP99]
MSDSHDTPIKTPKQLLYVVIAAFLVPILIIVLLVMNVTGKKKEAAGSEAFGDRAVAERLAPVARAVYTDPNAPKVLKTGEEVYKAVCTGCHAAGAAGAPKSGDAASWAPRIKLGLDTLVKSVINGKGAMPAKGGGSDLDNIEIARAVVYMANAAGGNFKEPAVPAAPAAAAPAAEAAPAAMAAPAVAAATSAPAVQTVAVGSGEKLYKAVCTACHAAGVAGAPKSGDKAAWGPRATKGADELTKTVISGKGAMPPRGGAGAASDAELKAAVQYMLAQLK